MKIAVILYTINTLASGEPNNPATPNGAGKTTFAMKNFANKVVQECFVNAVDADIFVPFFSFLRRKKSIDYQRFFPYSLTRFDGCRF